MSHGAYIVLEGPDGGGSTTHARLLCERLRRSGADIVQTAEPTDGPIGKCIRTELRGTGMPPDALQMLYSADRAWHMARVVRPALEKGSVVVGERCHVSTFMYGRALGLDVPWLERMNEHFAQPDLLLVLMPPFEVCAERLGIRDRDMLESDSLQRLVHDAYGEYMRSHPDAILIDTSGDIEPVAESIHSTVAAFLAGR